jgi:hypothetical protein
LFYELARELSPSTDDRDARFRGVLLSGRMTAREFKITEDELKVGKSSLATYFVIPVKLVLEGSNRGTGIQSGFPPTRE